MRRLNYSSLCDKEWDNGIINYQAQFHAYKGRRSYYIQNKSSDLAHLVEVAKVQSSETSNSIERIHTTETKLRQNMKERTTSQNSD